MNAMNFLFIGPSFDSMVFGTDLNSAPRDLRPSPKTRLSFRDYEIGLICQIISCSILSTEF